MNKTPMLSNEERRRRMAQWIWLNYYNEVLYAQGVINEDVRNRMKIKIDRTCQC